MQRLISTFLVLLVLSGAVVGTVGAQAPTPTQPFVVPAGGIAIIGFNFDDADEFAFVCLVDIPAGTEIRFTDNGWIAGNTNKFRTDEGTISWYTPGGCKLGQVVMVNPKNPPHNNNISGTFSLDDKNGDQILVYQYLSGSLNHIFAINSKGTDWQPTSSDKSTSARPPGLDNTNSIALDEIDNSVYIGPTSFTTTTGALAAIVNKANWEGSDTVRKTMPTGDFSFTTTAVELSEFSAATEGDSAPWWIIVVLIAVPAAILVFRRPKKECCR